jgi:hypothetical protein
VAFGRPWTYGGLSNAQISFLAELQMSRRAAMIASRPTTILMLSACDSVAASRWLCSDSAATLAISSSDSRWARRALTTSSSGSACQSPWDSSAASPSWRSSSSCLSTCSGWADARSASSGIVADSIGASTT